MEDNPLACSTCEKALPDPIFARNYPDFIYRECDARAVNNHGDFGRWAFLEISDPWDAKNTIRALLREKV
jgi:hypothetical protein